MKRSKENDDPSAETSPTATPTTTTSTTSTTTAKAKTAIHSEDPKHATKKKRVSEVHEQAPPEKHAKIAKHKKEAPEESEDIPTNTTMPSPAAMQHFHTEPHYSPKDTLKICSWNVNSLSASLKKGFSEYVKAEQADILCLQETKCNSEADGQKLKAVDHKTYPFTYWNCGTAKKGYAGRFLVGDESLKPCCPRTF